MTNVTRQSGENTEQVWAWGAGRQKTKDQTSCSKTPETESPIIPPAVIEPVASPSFQPGTLERSLSGKHGPSHLCATSTQLEPSLSIFIILQQIS
ncbi:hypothetical protein ATANTOWER_007555 [Ataeniobius toweri]|uniref:Uncharacterized protein n=1 Tax=Ataeniobius toweri TaxID=208326 RepID=A0ABU7BVE2_9TELE|nr:hypothetical protein [Ataeniobius toweri]